jgi:PAS domain S-box-containing protein
MKQAGLKDPERKTHSLGCRFKDWIRNPIFPYILPFRDRRFWVIQGMVIAIAVVHDVLESGGYLESVDVLYFLPISLFLVPVVYAAINFGFRGSIATAMWVVIITIPNWIFWHQGLERLGVIFQLAVLIAIAVFVGQRVDKESAARRQAEISTNISKASEGKYRGLFESSPLAIITVDDSGRVVDVNPAAISLFKREANTLKGMAFFSLFKGEDRERVSKCLSGNTEREDYLIMSNKKSRPTYLEPICNRYVDTGGKTTIQVLLKDVTMEHRRQAERKAYTAHVISGQEEERQRIARELHDETIQTLSLLDRQLTGIENKYRPLSTSLAEELQETKKTTGQVISGLRNFAKSLRPPTLDDLGIIASIRRLLLDFTEQSEIKGQLKLEGIEERLPKDIETAIFRITQESLRNIERHANATNITITVSFFKLGTRVAIADDGIGYEVKSNLENALRNNKLGLIGIHERAELLGGKIEIKSNPGKGTLVTAFFPKR